MSETTINNLPNEILTKILRHLDPGSLDNATLTCSRWKEIIEDSCPWPWKIDLKVESIVKWTEFSLATKRKCNKLMIRTVYSTNDILCGVRKIIQKKGFDIDELFLFDSIWSLTFFVEILKDLPRLKHLIVFDTKLKTDPEYVDLPELMELKTVQIRNSFGFGLLDCLKKSNLHTIQIRDCYHIHPDSIKDLLKSQKYLKTLALRFGDCVSDKYWRSLDGTLPFKLTSLSLQFHAFQSYSLSFTDDNLFKFMETQSQTLNSLESTGKFPNRFYELVFSKCKNLKSWRQSTHDIPRNWTFKKQFESKNITTLILVDTPYDRSTIANHCPVFFEEFIRCVPNVTDLTVNDACCESAMKVLSSNLKQVEKLAYRGVFDIAYSYAMQFPHLHTLNIRDFIPNSPWDAFIGNNTQITELSVNVILNDRAVKPMVVIQKFIDSLKQLKLQKLSIGKRYPSIPIIQSTMNIFNGLPFRDENVFNVWLDQEFWAKDGYYGSLEDKWVYKGRSSDYTERYKIPFTNFEFEGHDVPFAPYIPRVENVFAVLESDLNENMMYTTL